MRQCAHPSPGLTARPWARIPWLFLLVAAVLAGPQPGARAQGGGLSLRWPFEPGRDWQVMQGYNGSTHNSLQYGGAFRYALDLVLADPAAGALANRTAGQKVYAAADGELVPYFEAATGCYFLRHEARTANGAYLFTAYVHLDPAIDVTQAQQRRVTQGQLLGTVAAAGARGNGGIAHLHFAIVSSLDPLCPVGTRAPEPFDDYIAGWSFPASGGSNQYRGTIVRAAGDAPSATPALLAAAAQQATTTPTAAPASPTPAPTATPPPTATPVPTATSAPTASPSPTATPPPSPTVTETPSPPPTATPSPTATLPPAPTPVPTATPALPGPAPHDAQAPLALGLAGLGLAGLALARIKV